MRRLAQNWDGWGAVYICVLEHFNENAKGLEA
jgi:hypothetical protein